MSTTTQEALQSAASRVRRFLDERSRIRGLDQEQIACLHAGHEHQAELLSADLKLLAALSPAGEAEPAGARHALLKLGEPDTSHNAQWQGHSIKFHSVDQIIEWGNACYRAGLAAQPTTGAAAAPDQLERMRHIANEWADMATNGTQWLRNIRDGISTVEDALANMDDNYKHCRRVSDATGLYGQDAATPAPAPAAAQAVVPHAGSDGHPQCPHNGQPCTHYVECSATSCRRKSAPQAQAGAVRLPSGPALHAESGFVFDEVLAAVDPGALIPLTPQQDAPAEAQAGAAGWRVVKLSQQAYRTKRGAVYGGEHAGPGDTPLFAIVDERDAPAGAVGALGDWRIDHSTGRPILVYKDCSVIEAEQAQHVLALLWAESPRALGGEVRGLTRDEIADLWDAFPFEVTDLALAIDFVRDVEQRLGITPPAAARAQGEEGAST